VTCNKTFFSNQIGVFLGSLEGTERGDSKGISKRAKGGVEGTQTPCQSSNCAKMGTTLSGKHVDVCWAPMG
jgi:hypothetical protein